MPSRPRCPARCDPTPPRPRARPPARPAQGPVRRLLRLLQVRGVHVAQPGGAQDERRPARAGAGRGGAGGRALRRSGRTLPPRACHTCMPGLPARVAPRPAGGLTRCATGRRLRRAAGAQRAGLLLWGGGHRGQVCGGPASAAGPAGIGSCMLHGLQRQRWWRALRSSPHPCPHPCTAGQQHHGRAHPPPARLCAGTGARAAWPRCCRAATAGLPTAAWVACHCGRAAHAGVGGAAQPPRQLPAASQSGSPPARPSAPPGHAGPHPQLHGRCV